MLQLVYPYTVQTGTEHLTPVEVVLEAAALALVDAWKLIPDHFPFAHDLSIIFIRFKVRPLAIDVVLLKCSSKADASVLSLLTRPHGEIAESHQKTKDEWDIYT